MGYIYGGINIWKQSALCIEGIVIAGKMSILLYLLCALEVLPFIRSQHVRSTYILSINWSSSPIWHFLRDGVWGQNLQMCGVFFIWSKVSASMTERSPQTAQPPHKINYENSRRNFGYVGHPLVKCDTAFEFAQCAVKGSLSFWDPPVYVWIQFVIAFTNQNIFYFYYFVGESPLWQLTILQNLKQFKVVNLCLQGFEDWSCGHWRTYLTCLDMIFVELAAYDIGVEVIVSSNALSLSWRLSQCTQQEVITQNRISTWNVRAFMIQSLSWTLQEPVMHDNLEIARQCCLLRRQWKKPHFIQTKLPTKSIGWYRV
jgi:hypothetical protein